MPNIQEYEAPGLALRPSETGVEAFAAAGRRVGAFYDQAGTSIATAGARIGSGIATAGATAGDLIRQAEDSEAHTQISAGAKHGADLILSQESAWNNIVKDPNLDPNDPSVAKKFREESLEPALNQFRQGFTTDKSQQWADDFVDRFRTHMYQKTAADMSSMAGAVLHSNVQDMSNAWSVAARSDPSSVPFLLDNARKSVEGLIASSPTLGAEDAIRSRTLVNTIQKQIVRAGGLGAVENARDPQAAAEAFTSRFGTFLEPDETDGIKQAAVGMAHANAQHADAQIGLAQQQARDAFTAKSRDLETSVNLPGGAPRLPADYWQQYKQLATMPGADPNTVKSAYELGRAVTYRMKSGTPDPEPAASHATAVDLLTQMQRGTIAPADVYRAYGNGQLSGTDLALLDDKLKSLQTPDGQALARREGDFLQTIAPALTRGVDDQSAKLRLYDFQLSLDRKVEEYQRARKNPLDLFDPANPDYVGGPNAVAAFQGPSLQANLPSLANKSTATPTVEPRKPGETLPQWLARTGRGPVPMPQVPLSQ